MEAVKQSLLKFGKIELNTVVITVFLSLLVLSSLLFGNNFIVFFGILIIAGFFIWQTPAAGLLAALLTTMIFGEHFSLLPVQIEEVIYKIYALDFILMISFVCWLLKLKAGDLKFKDFLKEKKNLWLLVFLIFIIINLWRSFIFSSDLTLAAGTFKNYIYVLLYFWLIFFIKSKQDILRFLKIFLWGGGVLLIFVIYGWIAGRGLWSEVTPGLRYLSGLHSYYLTFPIIILLVLLVYKQYLFSYAKTLIFWLIQLAGMVGGMFRHLWLGILSAGVVILGWLGFKQKKNFIKLGFVILATAITLSLILIWASGLIGNDVNFTQNNFLESVVGRSKTLFSSGELIESAAGWRLQTWKVAWEKFIGNPLLGIGLGKKFFFEYRGFVDFIDIRNIHNDFASLLVQLGLLGFIPFVLFNYYSVKDLWQVLKGGDKACFVFTKPIGLMLLGFYIILLFGIFFGVYLMFNGTSIFYWSVMALITSLIILKKNKNFDI